MILYLHILGSTCQKMEIDGTYIEMSKSRDCLSPKDSKSAALPNSGHYMSMNKGLSHSTEDGEYMEMSNYTNYI